MASPTPNPESLGVSDGVTGLRPPSGSSGYFTDNSGPAGEDILFNIENDTDFNRDEVLGIMCPFPQEPNGVDPSEVSNYHFQIHSAKEHFATGDSTNVNNGTRNFSGSLAWGAVGYTTIQPSSIVIKTSNFVEGDVELVDNGSGALVSNGSATGTINYTNGAITLNFFNQRAPNGRIDIEYEVVPINYPTDWTVLTTWPNDTIKFAKGWFGRSSGGGVQIPRRTPANTNKGATRLLNFFKLIRDESLAASLPTYTELWCSHYRSNLCIECSTILCVRRGSKSLLN